MGSGPASDRSNGEGPSSRGLILRLRSPLARPVCAEGGPSRVLPTPPARPAAPRLPHPSPWKRPARPQACTSCSLHGTQQEPSAAPPRVSERLNQSLKAATLIALKQSPSPPPSRAGSSPLADAQAAPAAVTRPCGARRADRRERGHPREGVRGATRGAMRAVEKAV